MLNNHSLHLKIIADVKSEDRAIADVVADFAEAERRKLYFDYDCNSLFAYLMKHGYARACAQARIDAARMSIDLPSVLDSLRSGELNLAKISVVARACRRVPVTLAERAELLDKIKPYDERDSEIIVCRSLGIEPEIVEKIRAQADGSVRVEMTYTKDEWEIMQRAKEVSSHINPSPSTAELSVFLAEEYLERKDPARSSDPNSKPVSKRRQVFQKFKSCQWRHSSGELCGSRFQLQVDHIVPKWARGTDDFENLQILCAVHNRLKYRRGS